MPASASRIEHHDGVAVLLVPPQGEVRGAVIHIHGGGWCLGDPRSLQPALVGLARATSTLVASIDYRLAPEHRHPVALQDCVRAVRSLTGQWRNEYGFDAGRVVLAGESAGAHLALMALPLLRDAGLRFAGASLNYGLFDLSNTLPSRAGTIASPLLDAGACRFYVEAYLGEGACVDVASSPWEWPQKAFESLPPAMFCVGTADPLYDDSVGMHARWLAAGNEAWRVDYDAAPHAFDLLPVPEARHLADMRVEFVRYCLGDITKPH
ncbi:alpha/beta hydrolase [Luteimonas aestuarii]|nr:alpha/beta hydrolase [Luteimonas aestuarii]